MTNGGLRLKADGMGTLIRLKVHAGSRVVLIVKRAEDAYEVWVRAPVGRGQANKVALKMIAKALGQEVRNLRITQGRKSPDKIVRVL